MKEHHVSIWFLIGLQLAIFGFLITGAGIYGFFIPPPPEQLTVLSDLHPAIWWGAIMLALGIFYTVKFRPKKGE
jgi:FtsH-binding integral membrane protein